MNKRSNLPRLALATVLAACAHLVALLALGWKTPRLAAPEPAEDRSAPLIVSLVRPQASPNTRSGSTKSPARTIAARPQPSPAGVPGPAAPVATPTAPVAAQGAPDCAVEDLPLLTDAEKARCRNQIDADSERRIARGADERAARQVAQAQRGPQGYRMSSEKEAYYAAVADAYDQQSHGPPMAGHTPGVGCSVKFSGLKIVKSRPPPHSLSLGPCFLAPPQGFLTEESRIAPP